MAREEGFSEEETRAAMGKALTHVAGRFLELAREGHFPYGTYRALCTDTDGGGECVVLILSDPRACRAVEAGIGFSVTLDAASQPPFKI